MKEYKFKTEEEKNKILEELKEKGFKAIMVNQIINTTEGTIKV